MAPKAQCFCIAVFRITCGPFNGTLDTDVPFERDR